MAIELFDFSSIPAPAGEETEEKIDSRRLRMQTHSGDGLGKREYHFVGRDDG